MQRTGSARTRVTLVTIAILLGISVVSYIIFRSLTVYSINPSPAATTSSGTTQTLSPLEIQRGDNAAAAPSTNFAKYSGDGFSIGIPAGYVFDGVLTNYFPWSEVSWHSVAMDQLVSVEWEPYSPDSSLERDEEATITVDTKAGYTISHPIINGAASTTLIKTQTSSASFSGIYLWAIGLNGKIYSIVGLSSTAGAFNSISKIINSISFTN
jgi:hypothetical protein